MPKALIVIGLTLVAAGLVWQFAPGLVSWFGKLPGDIRITRGDSQIYIPITSMIIVSVILSVIINVFLRR